MLKKKKNIKSCLACTLTLGFLITNTQFGTAPVMAATLFIYNYTVKQYNLIIAETYQYQLTVLILQVLLLLMLKQK